MRSQADPEQTPVWEYTRLSEYAVPSEFSAEALRGLRQIWKGVVARFRLGKGTKGEEEKRDHPTTDVLEDVLPRFDVEAAVEGLATALADWPASEPAGDRTRVVIGPPGSHTREVVAALGRREDWKALELPTRAELLSRPEAIGNSLEGLDPGAETPVVIAELDRCLLRSERALPPIRALLGRLRALPCPLLIGCDSWTWSFLDRTLGIGDLIGEPLTLAAFDAPKLSGWLGPPLLASGRVCRPTDGPEKPVFGSPPDGGSDGASPALERLASASRGNPGVALELWKRCLWVGRGDKEADEPSSGARERTIWAAPLHRSEIVLPAQIEATHEFVLHAVLLHGHLETDLLHEVLPFPRHDLLRRVRDLRNQGLLAESDGRLSIPLAAYPGVRQYLGREGYLVDEF